MAEHRHRRIAVEEQFLDVMASREAVHRVVQAAPALRESRQGSVPSPVAPSPWTIGVHVMGLVVENELVPGKMQSGQIEIQIGVAGQVEVSLRFANVGEGLVECD